jgi:hypothetical protein
MSSWLNMSEYNKSCVLFDNQLILHMRIKMSGRFDPKSASAIGRKWAEWLLPPTALHQTAGCPAV